MKIFRLNHNFNDFRESLSNSTTVGFVPTLGALHDGHISLLSASMNSCDVSICSIFVNPTQFNEKSDLEKYPRPLDKDIYLLQKQGVDILYLPGVTEIYPDGTSVKPIVDLGEMANILEGAMRPGHFEGVVQVVHRLLSIVQPHKLFMGQKDFQQQAIIGKMINDLNIPVELVTCPTKREISGLAMSSRNERLSEQGRIKAANIYAVLNWVASLLSEIPLRQLEKMAIEKLDEHGFQTEYVAIIEPNSLAQLGQYSGQSAVITVASWLEGVRLIDNLQVQADH